MRLSAAVALCCLCTIAFAADPAHASIRKDTNIPAEGLGIALETLAKDYDFQVLYRTEVVKDRKTSGAVGSLTSDEALTKVLSGTGLSYKYLDASTVTIVPVAMMTAGTTTGQAQTSPNNTQDNSKEAGKKSSQDFRVAQVDQAPAGPSVNSNQNSKEEKKEQLEEVIVTGTNIRGVTETASPTTVYTQEDIEQSGVGSVQDFVRLLPNNFNGGASDATVQATAGGGTANNRVGGTSANLRGLGSDATLILIDGRRVAPGNINGNFVDISMIPLAAVDRIEVVPDGASAIYGSDAVGGVMNFIMKKNFDGAETQARYGSASGFHEIEAGQTVGHTWSSGSVLLSYDYYDRSPLYASDRSFTQAVDVPFTLLPSQQRNGLFLSVDENPTNWLQLFGDGYYSRRNATVQYTDDAFDFQANEPSLVSSYAGTLGARAPISDDIGLELSGTYSGSRNHQTITLPGIEIVDEQTNTSVWSTDLKIDGALGSTWAGRMRFAVGGQFRQETLSDDNRLSQVVFSPSRKVTAGFAELQIPLLAPSTSESTVNVLELSLAGRAEHYSDFGSTSNPKIGLIWRPLAGVKIRGTYGTSFKAPNLFDLNPIPSETDAAQGFDPRSGKDEYYIIPFGGNPELRPETARSWSFGFDLQPSQVQGFHASATYYNISFKNLISTIQQLGFNVFDALGNSALQSAGLIQYNPPAALVQQYLNNPNYFDNGLGPLTPAQITAIVDSRSLNLSAERTSGVDFSISEIMPVAFGKLDVGIDGTYILVFDDRITTSSPDTRLLNTPYQPVNLKVRAHAGLQIQALTLTGYVNYVNSYDDPRVPPTVQVSSWTTVDLSARYDFRGKGFLSNSALQLNVTNLADRRPPFVAPIDPTVPIPYDGANANPVGREVSIQLSKRW